MSSDDVARRIAFLQRRLVILDALSTAAHRRSEVIETIARTGSERAAISAVEDLLSVTTVSARAVVELRLSAFSGDARNAVNDERSAIAEELRTLEA